MAARISDILDATAASRAAGAEALAPAQAAAKQGGAANLAAAQGEGEADAGRIPTDFVAPADAWQDMRMFRPQDKYGNDQPDAGWNENSPGRAWVEGMKDTGDFALHSQYALKGAGSGLLYGLPVVGWGLTGLEAAYGAATAKEGESAWEGALNNMGAVDRAIVTDDSVPPEVERAWQVYSQSPKEQQAQIAANARSFNDGKLRYKTAANAGGDVEWDYKQSKNYAKNVGIVRQLAQQAGAGGANGAQAANTLRELQRYGGYFFSELNRKGKIDEATARGYGMDSATAARIGEIFGDATYAMHGAASNIMAARKQYERVKGATKTAAAFSMAGALSPGGLAKIAANKAKAKGAAALADDTAQETMMQGMKSAGKRFMQKTGTTFNALMWPGALTMGAYAVPMFVGDDDARNVEDSYGVSQLGAGGAALARALFGGGIRRLYKGAKGGVGKLTGDVAKGQENDINASAKSLESEFAARGWAQPHGAGGPANFSKSAAMFAGKGESKSQNLKAIAQYGTQEQAEKLGYLANHSAYGVGRALFGDEGARVAEEALQNVPASPRGELRAAVSPAKQSMLQKRAEAADGLYAKFDEAAAGEQVSEAMAKAFEHRLPWLMDEVKVGDQVMKMPIKMSLSELREFASKQKLTGRMLQHSRATQLAKERDLADSARAAQELIEAQNPELGAILREANAQYRKVATTYQNPETADFVHNMLYNKTMTPADITKGLDKADPDQAADYWAQLTRAYSQKSPDSFDYKKGAPKAAKFLAETLDDAALLRFYGKVSRARMANKMNPAVETKTAGGMDALTESAFNAFRRAAKGATAPRAADTRGMGADDVAQANRDVSLRADSLGEAWDAMEPDDVKHLIKRSIDLAAAKKDGLAGMKPAQVEKFFQGSLLQAAFGDAFGYFRGRHQAGTDDIDSMAGALAQGFQKLFGLTPSGKTAAISEDSRNFKMFRAVYGDGRDAASDPKRGFVLLGTILQGATEMRWQVMERKAAALSEAEKALMQSQQQIASAMRPFLNVAVSPEYTALRAVLQWGGALVREGGYNRVISKMAESLHDNSSVLNDAEVVANHKGAMTGRAKAALGRLADAFGVKTSPARYTLPFAGPDEGEGQPATRGEALQNRADFRNLNANRRRLHPKDLAPPPPTDNANLFGEWRAQ